MTSQAITHTRIASRTSIGPATPKARQAPVNPSDVVNIGGREASVEIENGGTAAGVLSKPTPGDEKTKADIAYCEKQGLSSADAASLVRITGERDIEKAFGDFTSLLEHSKLEDTESRERWDAISYLGRVYAEEDPEQAEKMMKDKLERVSFQRFEVAGFKGVFADQMERLSGPEKEAFQKYVSDGKGSEEEWFWIRRRGESDTALDVLATDLDFQETWNFGIGDPAKAKNKRFGDSREARWELYQELAAKHGPEVAEKRMNSFNFANLNVFEMRTCVALPDLSPSVVRDLETAKKPESRSYAPDYTRFQVSEPF